MRGSRRRSKQRPRDYSNQRWIKELLFDIHQETERGFWAKKSKFVLLSISSACQWHPWCVSGEGAHEMWEHPHNTIENTLGIKPMSPFLYYTWQLYNWLWLMLLLHDLGTFMFVTSMVEIASLISLWFWRLSLIVLFGKPPLPFVHGLLFVHLCMWRCLGGSILLLMVSLVAQVCFTMFQRGLGGGVVKVTVILYLVMVGDFRYQYS